MASDPAGVSGVGKAFGSRVSFLGWLLVNDGSGDERIHYIVVVVMT